MTIENANLRQQHSVVDLQADYGFNFKILKQTDLKVVLSTSAGVDTVQTLTTHYTVSGVGSQNGGTVTFTAGNIPATSSSAKVTLILDTELKQAMDLSYGVAIDSEALEGALDNSININKRSRDLVDRSLNLPDGDVDGSGAYDAKSNRIKNLGAPTGDNDAATKSYADSVVAAAVLDPSVTVTPYAATILDDANAAAAQLTLGGGAKGVAIFQDDSSTDVMTELGMTTFSQDLLTGNGNAQQWQNDLLIQNAIVTQIPLTLPDHLDIAGLNTFDIPVASTSTAYGSMTAKLSNVLHTQTVTNVASCIIPVTAGVDMFRLELRDYKPVNNSVSLRMTFSVDGGSTYLSTLYQNYLTSNDSTGGNSATVSNSAAFMTVHNIQPNAVSSPHLEFSVTPAAGAGTRNSIYGTGLGYGTSGTLSTQKIECVGSHSSTTRLTHIKLEYSAGNIAQMTTRLYQEIN